jgi:DNA/RNA-binding domain of Phe-tRNA-synthetase-like protein
MMEKPDLITVDPIVNKTYPGAHAGVLAVRGAANPKKHAGLDERKDELEQTLRKRFSGKSREDLKMLPSIGPYEAYYGRFKKTYHVLLQLESVVLKSKPLPSVAALVEAMFMAELENQLLTAGHDLAAVEGAVRLGIATGEERYTLLNGQDQTLRSGDMYMADSLGVISSILYGPDQRTRLTPNTHQALFAVYAPPGIQPEAVRSHLETIYDNLRTIAPAAEVIALEVV